MNSTFSNFFRYSVFGFFTSLLLAPLIFYINQFGIGVWSTNEDWSRMGSALGGIYTVILSSLSLVFLYMQTRHMNQQGYREFLRDQEKLLSDYILLLEQRLNEISPLGTSYEIVIVNIANAIRTGQMNTSNLNAGYGSCAHAIDVWFAIVPVLDGLKAAEHYLFEILHDVSVTKIKLSIGKTLARDLELITNCLSDGKMNSKTFQ